MAAPTSTAPSRRDGAVFVWWGAAQMGGNMAHQDSGLPAEAEIARAMALQSANNHQEAVAIYDRLLAADPDLVPALINRGVALRALKRPQEALEAYKRALTLQPDNGRVWYNMGNLLAEHGEAKQAAESMTRAMELIPDNTTIRLAAAAAMLAAGKTEAARKIYGGLVENPACGLEGLLGLSACYRRSRDWAAAIATAERAASAFPTMARAHYTLAEALMQAGRYDEAEAPLRRAIALSPDDITLLSRLGQLAISRHDFDGAEAALSEVLRRDPKHLDARLGWARVRLLRGEIPDAWNDYSWRWQRPQNKKPFLDKAEWDGSPQPDKTLMLYCEQGMGDSVQFARFATHAAKLVGKVVLLVPPALRRVLETVPGVAQVAVPGKKLPDFDLHLPLMDVPRVLRLGHADVGMTKPYIKAPAETTLRRLVQAQGFRVGVVWAGNPDHDNDHLRSIAPDRLVRLARFPQVRLIGLQKGAREKDNAAFAEILPNIGPRLQDMAATAAVLEELDLVVTIDSSVAHVAAALGRPVWMLVPYAPDWRWYGLGEDTPWYPTMRLFRQRKEGDWDEVLGRVETGLADLLAPGRGVSIPSIFRHEDGRPRFVMELPRHLMRDAGISYLHQRETRFLGYEPATRAFLDAHVRSGDLFVDVGAHWGMMTLQALTRHDDVRAVAIEASPVNAAQLRRWLAINGVADRVDVVHAGAWNTAEGEGSVSPQSTMGHSVKPGKSDMGGPTIPLVTIDGCVQNLAGAAGRRVIIKIDVEGNEPEVIEGARALIDSGRVAAIIWERGGQYDEGERRERLSEMVAALEAKGFTHWHFPHEDAGGALVPWVLGEEFGNVFALAPGVEPLACYRPPVRRTPPSRPMRPLALREDRRLEHVERMIAAKAPDAARWAWVKQLEPGAHIRAQAAAPHLAGAASVVDLGAGLGRLRAALPNGVAVRAVDLVLWPWVDEALDLDARFPEGRWDAAAMLGLLAHLHRPEEALKRARAAAGRLVLSYPLVEDFSDAKQRRIAGCFNDFTRTALHELLERAGWRVDAEEKIGLETVFACR